MKEIRIRIMKEGSLFQAFLEGGKQTDSFMTVDTALLALLFLNGDKFSPKVRCKLATLAEDYDLAGEIAPEDVVGLKATLGDNCYLNIEQIKKGFQFPPEATKRWRVTHDDYPGEVWHVWRSGFEKQFRGDCNSPTMVYRLRVPAEWLLNPERMHWEVIANES